MVGGLRSEGGLDDTESTQRPRREKLKEWMKSTLIKSKRWKRTMSRFDNNSVESNTDNNTTAALSNHTETKGNDNDHEPIESQHTETDSEERETSEVKRVKTAANSPNIHST
uniref:AlNc14C75G5080 protein n=1 Tax=Albugo laibachii Nc14 TaxID=890382 RepID=F0WEN0_9STRA|nr:AlNc14C75G5080 [Albugo laibachii Nc14]|eukprot:CCA19662.1 AlNc14C75G5080 [Albugo laibachii Nc14]